MKSRLSEIALFAEKNHDLFKQTLDQIDSLRQDTKSAFLTQETRERLRELLFIPVDLIVQRRILDDLGFDGMYQRNDEVANAHSETFQWIFDKVIWENIRNESGASEEDSREGIAGGINTESNEASSKDNGDDGADKREIYSIKPDSEHGADQSHPNNAARKAFVTWLLHGDGIFHISGKLGSGKSTLMKFLCHHELTKKLLQQWAGTCFVSLHTCR